MFAKDEKSLLKGKEFTIFMVICFMGRFTILYIKMNFTNPFIHELTTLCTRLTI